MKRESFTHLRAMTPEDKQIDLLISRHARRATTNVAVADHLDADELSTFAEGALPPAARARYVSHLANCDQCRKLVAQLAINTGVTVAAESARAENKRRWWQGFGSLFTPRALRYAGFAAMLLIAAGITFIALRKPERPNDLVATKNDGEQHPSSALQPSAASNNNGATQSPAQPSGSPSTTTTPGVDQFGKRDGDKVADAAPMPTLAKEPASSPDADRANTLARDQPAYAPPPPSETAKPAAVAGAVQTQEEKKAEQSLDKVATANRQRSESSKDARDDNLSVVAGAQPTNAARRVADEKLKGPSRNMDYSANRNLNENRAEPMTLGTAAPKPAAKEETQTRSAGGRKFRKQGSAWVDQKFKSSMTLKSIARGSDEFNALDSGLRSIAQQFGGEVIVVWKGKAYLIK